MHRDLRADQENVRGARLWQSGRLDEAIKAFRAAVQRDPDHGEAARNLGNALREAARFDEAVRYFERAIASNPLDGRAHRYLVETRASRDPEHERAMEELLLHPQLGLDDRIELHFALGAAYAFDDLSPAAFEHLHRANSLKRSTLTYSESNERLLHELLVDMFNPDIVAAARGLGNASALPIFIVGMPRSGTTLVEQLLAAHPGVQAFGELDAFERALGEFNPPASDPRNAHAFAQELGAALRDVGTRYVEGLEKLVTPSAVRATDKMPSNYRFAVAIHLALPNAKIVHVRRDPLDTCLSCYATNFVDGQYYSYDLTELGRYYCLYREHMRYVRGMLPPSVFFEVTYEDLVTDFETHARCIVEHCGLSWDASCMEFWRVERPVRSASVVQVRRPLFASSMGRAHAHAQELAPLIAALRNSED
jgi:tetratricopeptide (TPR) repeat protein